MAKARSPSYPAISLKEAIDRVNAVYGEDYQNAISREVVAKHMGYQSLNGKSLGVLSAVIKYGLLEGRGNDTRVSDLAVRLIAHPPGSPERAEAVRDAARRPELFAELDQRFADGRGSDAAIRSYLLTQKFIPPAADAALRAYRETKQFVAAESASYTEGQPSSEQLAMPATTESTIPHKEVSSATEAQAPSVIFDKVPTSMRRAVFDLTEGEVVLTFPDELSPESVSDLQDYLNVFMKKARREAGLN